MQSLLLIVTLSLAWLLWARPAQAAFEEELVLPNGLKVILAPQAGNPLVSVRLMVKTGSGGEGAAGEFGLAHLLEHMAFKSTAGGRGEGEIAWEVESAGGSIGAYTWLDETVYHLTLPRDESALAFELLADMVFAPALDPDEFAREKEVVVEEIKKYADQPGDVLADNLYGLVFGGQAYGHPVIGYEESVRGATVAGTRAFLAKHYRPGNMVLIVSGGFRPEALKPQLKVLGALPPGRRPLEEEAASSRPAPKAGPGIKIVASPKTDLALAEIAFRAFPGRDPDSVPAELLAAVLSQTQTSRLDEKVKSEAGLVTAVSCHSSAFREAGLFSVYLETEAEKLDEAVRAVLAELEHLAAEPPDEDELRRVRALSANYFLSQQESSEGLGRVLGEFENFSGDWRLKDARLSQWDRVDAGDLLRVARRLFRPDNAFISIVLPQRAAGEGDRLRQSLLGQAAELGLADDPAAVGTAAEDLEIFDLGPGESRLMVLQDQSLPLITIKAGVLGGLLAESPETEGLASLTAEVWPLAAGGRQRAEFLREAERLGAAFSATSGRNSFFLTARFPSRNREEGLRLLLDILREPVFAAEDLDEARAERLADLRQQAEDPAAMAGLLARRALFGPDHPYGLNPLGREATVAAFRPETLADFYEELVRPERLVVSAAGDVDGQWLKEELSRALAGWANKKKAGAIAWPAGAEPPTEPRLIRATMADRAQTHLRLEFPTPGLGQADQAALEVLADYLGGGMGGPLFMELRERQSLAYDLYSLYQPGLNGGEFIFYIAADPAKAEAAARGLAEVIEQCRAGELDEEELEGARRLTLGKRKRGEETAAERAEAALLWQLYGLGPDFEARHQAAIAAVSAADLKRVAEVYLRPERGVMVQVGPAAPPAP